MKTLSFICVMIIAFVAVSAVAAPGDLDLSFGNAGIVTTAIGSGSDLAKGVAVQSDGKIIAAGYSSNGSSNDFSVVRYNTDGTLDTTFNTTGKLTTDFGGDDYANSIVLQSDGKIVVAGYTNNGSYKIAVARYNTNGSPDSTFGPSASGKVTTISMGYSIAYAVTVQSDGKIIVVGGAGSVQGPLIIVRYNTDGSLDNTFNGTGANTVMYSQTGDFGYAVAVQNDGKIVVTGSGTAVATGYPQTVITKVRFNSDGTRDSTFTNGFLAIGTAVYGAGVALQGDGKVVVAGYSAGDSNGSAANGHFYLSRFTASGDYDTSFGGGSGWLSTPVGIGQDTGRGVALQGDGKIVVAGYSYNGNTTFNDFAVVRYNNDGSLDTSFQTTGKVRTSIGNGNAYAQSLALQNDGRIVVAGYSSNGTKNLFTIARYQAFGNLAVTVPTNGLLTHNNLPIIAGTADVNATLNIFIDGSQAGSVVADNTGAWSFTPTAPLTDGSHVVNAANSTGTTSNTSTFTVDTIAPAAPLLQTPSNGAFTNNTRPFISGIAEPNTIVTIFLDGTISGTTMASRIGAWSYAPATALTDGQHAVKAQATDRAGNLSPFSAINQFLSSSTTAGTPGDLDISFGTGGIVTTTIGAGSDLAKGVVVQSDGKIVAAGYSRNSISNDFSVVRYNPDGTLDTTFNATGKVITDFGGDDYANGLVLQSDGKIVAAGYTNNGSYKIAVARYNTDGSLDTTFGPASSGKITTISMGYSKAYAVTVQIDGKIIVVGGASSVQGPLIIVRYNADGTLDSSFNGTGANTVMYSQTGDFGYAVAVQSDGKIVVTGSGTAVATGYPQTVITKVRFNADGTRDNNFTNGFLAIGTAIYGAGVAMQGDGKVIVTGYSAGNSNGSSSNGHFYLSRFTTSGDYDTSFGGGSGWQSTPVGIGQDTATSLALQGDGRIVVAGYSYNGNTTFNDFAVLRYNNDGSLDSGFHSTGKVRTSIGIDNAYAQSVAIQNDGRIVVAGYSNNGTKNVFTIARYFGSDQPPITNTVGASNVTKTTATLAGTANPNSLATTAHFEYGLTTSYGSVTADQACGIGTTAVSLNSAITGLAPNTTYHFRLVAMNAATLFGGTTYGADATFTTAADPPVAVTAAATTVSAAAATLAGVVFPNGRVTSVYFDYGLTTTYTNSTSVQTIPAGTSAVNVFAAITGLVANGTYHFRVVANNAGTPFPIQGLDQTFVAQAPPPTVTLGAASSLTTTSVGLSGTVNGNSVDAQVFFDYGTDGVTFPFSVAATPVTVIGGSGVTPVSGSLVNLSQGVVYYYRLRAVSAGGQGISGVASFTLGIISGLNQTFPTAAPDAYGFALVTLTPAGILSGWRFVGEQSWRASGVPAVGLTTGDRDIEFRPVPGYIQPPQETVSIISGAAATVLTRDYFVAASSGSGGISVTLKPDSIATSTVAVATRAQWRFLGEDDTQWRDTGATVNGLAAGSYSVECKPVSGRATPTLATVVVQTGQTSAPTLTYFLADTVSGTSPSALAFESFADPTKPYAYVGQIRSSVGVSTGFVVMQRVVATAGHVVFDDGTLSTAQGLQWLYQREAGTYEPVPQTPRGYYIFDGYTAQRAAENTPGTSSPQSQTLDVAAMYFLADAGRGGSYGGFLASDNVQNEFLISSANKMLVGYPVNGIAPSSQGRMFATPPANVTFTSAYGRTYTTADISSVGGNSGGPLCVQYQGGAYYPAAVYLGGTGLTVVRAIDSAVIDLFNRAQVSGNGGANNTGGGITQTSVTAFGSVSNPGALAVTITPAAAVTAGAGWRLSPESSYRQSGAQKSGLSAGTYVLQLTTVPGYQAPTPQSVAVAGGQLTSITFTYAAPLSAQQTWRQTYFGVSTSTGNAADTATPAGDGIPNLMKYALNLDPTKPSKLPTSANLNGSNLECYYTRSTAAVNGGTQYQVEWSDDLSTWSSTGVTQTILSDDGTVQQIKASMPAGSGGHRFVHLRVQ